MKKRPKLNSRYFTNWRGEPAGTCWRCGSNKTVPVDEETRRCRSCGDVYAILPQAADTSGWPGLDNAIGIAPKSPRGAAVDIGDGFRVMRHGLDENGNHSVWVSYKQGRAKKIQTNGNLPAVHHPREGRGVITVKGAAEIKDYYRAHCSRRAPTAASATAAQGLPSTRNTAAIERKIRGAFRSLHRARTFETFFEHGHWWVRRPRRDEDETYDVVDATGPGSENGFAFERV